MIVSPATLTLWPWKKYSLRRDAALAEGGSVQRAPGSMRSVQIATSASACAAQESGGGASGSAASTAPLVERWPSRRPAMTATSVTAPSPLSKNRCGMSSAHSIVKCGSAILLRAGRFSQIWNSSSGLALPVSSSGNISECTMPLPAVSHCTSPPPKRAAAPSESEWSVRPLRTMVTVSKPRCGCDGKPGTACPWYMLQPSLRPKSWPMLRPASDASGPKRPLPFG